MNAPQRRLVIGLLFSAGTLLFFLAAASLCFLVAVFPARFAIFGLASLVPLLIVSAQALRFAFAGLDGGEQSARLPSSFPSGTVPPLSRVLGRLTLWGAATFLGLPVVFAVGYATFAHAEHVVRGVQRNPLRVMEAAVAILVAYAVWLRAIFARKAPRDSRGWIK